MADQRQARIKAEHGFVLLWEDTPRFAIVVEVQLSPDEEKRYTWPVYITHMRARLRCPTVLLVVVELCGLTFRPGDRSAANRLALLFTRSRSNPAVSPGNAFAVRAARSSSTNGLARREWTVME